MTNLSKLKVSLTKHGAHKIATLLKIFEPDEILEHLSDSNSSIHIERAQAKKNLSAYSDGKLPSYWFAAKNLGDDHIDALVLLAIVFSHEKLIRTLIESSDSPYQGTLTRGNVLKGKEYTNFAHILDELGFAVVHRYEYVRYSFEYIFFLPDLGFLAHDLLKEKLLSAGWDGNSKVAKEAFRLNFHLALGISKKELYTWLSKGTLSEARDSIPYEGYLQYQEPLGSSEKPGEYKFEAGHNLKSEEETNKVSKAKLSVTHLVHNQIQNSVYQKLVAQFGKEHVGTEVSTGCGTYIDIALNTPEGDIFFEIKTAPDLKSCIRQAISQLLEYSYWPNENRAVALIIIAPHELNQSAKLYLNRMRNQFGIPIYYHEFRIDTQKMVICESESFENILKS